MLSFDDDPSLAPLRARPWELLHDKTEGASKNVAADRDTPFSRFIAGTGSGKTIDERPLQMLVAIASPRDYKENSLAEVDEDQERQIVTEAFADLASGQVELDFVPAPVTLPRLQQHLKKRHYHILHIVAHGRYAEGYGADLYLVDDQHKAKRVRAEELAQMMGQQGESIPDFVFLASCETAKQSAKVDEVDPFQNVASSLIEIGVPAVLAMQAKVHIPTSQAFTREFYRELFRDGYVDLACNAARSMVLTKELLGSHVPVLFSRLYNNRLLVPRLNAVVVRKDFEPETVYIRSSTFLMGSMPGPGIPKEETDRHPVELSAYRIGKYPVTNREYAEFLKHRYKPEYRPKGTGWVIMYPPKDKLEYPVVGVSWHDAQAYCAWLTEATGRTYRLPTEAEWEKAARGTEGWIYPWGDEWGEGCARAIGTDHRTTPAQVGVKDAETDKVVPDRPKGASPCGCYDMVGSVQEWTNTLWGGSESENDYPYPYEVDERESREAPQHLTLVYRVHRGGELGVGDGGSAENRLRCAIRGRSLQETEVTWRGFRVVCEV